MDHNFQHLVLLTNDLIPIIIGSPPIPLCFLKYTRKNLLLRVGSLFFFWSIFKGPGISNSLWYLLILRLHCYRFTLWFLRFPGMDSNTIAWPQKVFWGYGTRLSHSQLCIFHVFKTRPFHMDDALMLSCYSKCSNLATLGYIALVFVWFPGWLWESTSLSVGFEQKKIIPVALSLSNTCAFSQARACYGKALPSRTPALYIIACTRFHFNSVNVFKQLQTVLQYALLIILIFLTYVFLPNFTFSSYLCFTLCSLTVDLHKSSYNGTVWILYYLEHFSTKPLVCSLLFQLAHSSCKDTN